MIRPQLNIKYRTEQSGQIVISTYGGLDAADHVAQPHKLEASINPYSLT